MYKFPFGPQFAVVPGPGGTVKLEPGPEAMTGGPGRGVLRLLIGHVTGTVTRCS
jgi:hypothetical protein